MNENCDIDSTAFIGTPISDTYLDNKGLTAHCDDTTYEYCDD